MQSNVERDRRVERALADAGRRVIRSWEHELPEVAAARIAAALMTARDKVDG